MRYAVSLMTFAAAFALVGCLGEMNLPKDFVAAEKADLGDYHVRGISADGVAVGLRSEDNQAGGTVDFWAKAIANELTTARGYTLDGTETVTTRSGLAGKIMTFSAWRSGTAFTYVIGVFVKDGKVLVAEAGGKADAVKEHSKALRDALLSVR